VTEPVLVVEDLTLAFGGVVALNGFNIKVSPGEIHGVIGPNGAGKTTAFDVVTGVYRQARGSVRLDGTEITQWAPHRRTRAGIGRSFQTVGLAPGLTARDNVRATIEALERVWTPFQSRGAVRRLRAQVQELLAFFHLEEVADTQVTDLPLGTTKLLELAKVFAGRPKVVLLDEPFAGLSSAEGAARVALISERRRQVGSGVIVIEHDVPLLSESCDTLTVLDAGTVVTCGPPHQVMADQAVREAYMGEVVEESVT
jgi:branched-chain amino acid transport system ATP-binding protein